MPPLSFRLRLLSLRRARLGATLQSFVSATVRLPESFRGGCSFGTGLASSPDANRIESYDKTGFSGNWFSGCERMQGFVKVAIWPYLPFGHSTQAGLTARSAPAIACPVRRAGDLVRQVQSIEFVRTLLA